VRLRFDYHEDLQGATIAGPWLTIDETWVIPCATYSNADITLDGEPADEELDYALLRLSTPAGDEDLPGGRRRGWVDLSGEVHLPEEHTPILIVQHPRNASPPPTQMSLQVSFDTPGFQSLNANGTRMVYTPSTEKGSSGSPVFDRRLRPVALHHNRGEIDANAIGLSKNNRGIPLKTIKAHLPEDIRALLLPGPG
jgi:hypothetical protein